MSEPKQSPMNLNVNANDLLSSSFLSNHLVNSFVSHSKSFKQQIATVILMTSIDEIKKIIKMIFEYLTQNYSSILSLLNPINIIKSIFNFVITSLIDIKYSIKNMFTPKVKYNDMSIVPYTYDDKTNITNIQIIVTKQFLQNILNYIEKNKKTSTIQSDNISNIKIVNKNEILSSRHLHKLSIKYNDMEINCNLNMIIEFNSQTKLITDNIKLNQIKLFAQNNIIPIAQQDTFSKQTALIIQQIRFENIFDKNTNLYKLFNCLSSMCGGYTEQYDVFIYSGNNMGFAPRKVNNIKFDKSFESSLLTVLLDYKKLKSAFQEQLLSNIFPQLEILSVLLYLHTDFSKLLQESYDNKENKRTTTTIKFNTSECNNVPLDLEMLKRNSKLFNHDKTIIINTNVLDDLFIKVYQMNKTFQLNQLYVELKALYSDMFKNSTKDEDTKSIEFNFDIVDYDEFNFNSFIKDINENYAVETDKIKIHNVNYLETRKTTEIDNPEYTKIKNKLDKLINEKNDKNEEIILELKKQLVSLDEKITKEDVTRKLECKFITEKSKHFSTLYLRKTAKTQLFNLIKDYKTNKDNLLKLGLPDKLGIMLEGLPGTGKTSAIWAIATYLKKDIYYINLNTVKTNDELTYIFNYINNETSGGIIVFEDIDCMTNTVLQRSGETFNDTFSLSHLLNILQGTLTADGTMYIITTNHIEHLDKALYRAGRIDLIIKMLNTDHFQYQEIYKNFFNKEMQEHNLKKLPEDTFSPAAFITYCAKNLWNTEMTEDELIDTFLELH